jgi:hypothetical protein
VLNVTLDVAMPAGRTVTVENDRSRDIFDENALDLPDHGLAPPRIGLLRLLLQQGVDLGITVMREVRIRLAGKAHLQHAVGVIDASAGEVERDRVIPLE